MTDKIEFFGLSVPEQQLVIQQTAERLSLPVQAVEKDLWVSCLLQILFDSPLGNVLVFKGGTSLSKIWRLIDRFSEDIDLAIDRRHFGLDGDLTKRQLKSLRKKSSLFVKNDLCQVLTSELHQYGLSGLSMVEVEPDGEGDGTYPEPRKIFIRYRSLFDVNPYINSQVLLEVGARSLMEPASFKKVHSFVNETFPQFVLPLDVEVKTVMPQKTFLEKAFLLHELFSGNTTMVAERKSRHLYDLEKIMDLEYGFKAISDTILWEAIRHHREVFTSVSGVDYASDIRKNIQLVPPSRVMLAWKADYERMQTSMLSGESLTFEELIVRMEELEKRFSDL